MVCGADKAAPVREVMGQGSPDTYPVKHVQPTHGEFTLVPRSCRCGAAAIIGPSAISEPEAGWFPVFAAKDFCNNNAPSHLIRQWEKQFAFSFSARG